MSDTPDRTSGRPLSKGFDAAQRARHAIHVALAHSLSATEHRVLLAALELTVGWSKPVDRVVRRVIAERARVSERSVSRALAKLGAIGAVGWSPAKAAGQLGTLALPETACGPECAGELGTACSPESDPAPETDPATTRDRIACDPGQHAGSLPREPRETARAEQVILDEWPTRGRDAREVATALLDRGLSVSAIVNLVEAAKRRGAYSPRFLLTMREPEPARPQPRTLTRCASCDNLDVDCRCASEVAA